MLLKMEYFGNKDIIKLYKTAFFCSRKCPAEIILKSLDWAKSKKNKEECVISCFHSRIEKDVFDIYKEKYSFTIFFLPDNISYMVKREKNKIKFKKVISEQFPVNPKRGGGLLKIEAWENDKGEIVKYSMAYINHFIFSGDNGRVLGYDNTHNFHHKHYFGEISEVLDFTTYQDLVERFENEVKEFIK